MTPTEMSETILHLVRTRGGALINELVECIGLEAIGTGHIRFSDKENVVLWAGVSETFVEAFNLAAVHLEMRRASPGAYLFFADEGIPLLPVVSAEDWEAGKLEYDHKRWLPLVFFMQKEGEHVTA